MCLGLIGVVSQVVESDGFVGVVVDVGTRTVDAPVLSLPSPVVGDYVIVHMGYVLEVLDPVIAAEMLEARTLLTEPS